MKKTIIVLHEKTNKAQYLIGTEEQIRTWLERNGGEKQYLLIHPGERLYSMAVMLAGDQVTEL